MQIPKLRARWVTALMLVAALSPPTFGHDVPKPIALVNGRILTAEAGKVIEKGTVLIKDEKIAAIGTDVKIPKGARTIDVSGMTISPGLIDVRSTLWYVPDSVNSASSNGSLNPREAVDTFSEDWIEVAKQGVTSICIHPRGSMGGRCVVLRVADAGDVAHLTIEEASGIQASLVSSGTSTSRYAQYTAMKRTLEGVKKYQAEWKKYHEALKKWEEEQKKKKSGKGKDAKKGDKAKADAKKKEEKKPAAKMIKVIRMRGRVIPIDKIPPQVLQAMKARGAKIEEIAAPGGTTAKTSSSSSKSKDGKPKEPKRDKVKDVLVKLLERKIPLRIEVHRADEAANALKLGEEMKIDVVLEGLSNLGRSWEAIHKQRPPLVAGPMVAWETAPTGRRTNWFSEVAANEGVVAISTFSRTPRGSRFLRTHAAAAVAQGLTSDRAFEAITINAAKVLGVHDKVGSLKVGKHGDIAVFAGHPTDPAAPVMLTISQGQITYEAKDKLTPVTTKRAELSGLPPELPDSYALKSSRVQKKDGTFGPATVVVKGGKIVSVGDVGGDDAFDLGDAVITPGLVVGHAPSSTSSSVDPITAHTHAADNYNPDSEGFRKMTQGGFTAVAYAPESSNVVAGQMGCIRFGAMDPVAMKDGMPMTIAGKFVLSAASRSTSRYPSALAGQIDILNQYFKGEDEDKRLFVPGSVEAVMDKKAAALLTSIKAGEVKAVFEASTNDEVRAALDLIEAHKLKAVLLTPQDLTGVIDRIKELKVGIIARAVQVADYDWYAADIAAASKKGIPLAISATTPEEIRATAALLVNAGMAPDAAVRALTSDAAQLCGLNDAGQISSGKPADLVIWSGSPVDLGAHPAHVIVDGQTVKETP